jgi:hypothetical protein
LFDDAVHLVVMGYFFLPVIGQLANLTVNGCDGEQWFL